jgi:hypothetical protein
VGIEMKNPICFRTSVLFLVLGVAISSAEDSASRNNTYSGLLLGSSFSRFIGENSDANEFYGGGEKRTRIGVVAGAFTHLGMGKYLALEPQVLFSQKGAMYGGYDPSWNDELTFKLDYVEVPVILRVYFSSGTSIRMNILGGGYGAYNVIARYKYTEYGYLEEGDLEDALSVHMENIDYGVLFGAGVTIQLRNVILRIDTHYSLGLVRIFDVPPDNDLRNGVISLNASIGMSKGDMYR